MQHKFGESINSIGNSDLESSQASNEDKDDMKGFLESNCSEDINLIIEQMSNESN